MWWYLSFVGEKGWRGGCYVYVETTDLGREGVFAATMKAHMLKINPGGTVAAVPKPPGAPDPEPHMQHRLLNHKDEGLNRADGTPLVGKPEHCECTACRGN